MTTLGNVWHGHTSSSIHKLSVDCRDLFTQFNYVLITMIDSGEDVRGMWAVSPSLKRLNLEVEFLGRGAVTAARNFFKLASGSVSNGFDEYWFYVDKPTLVKPEQCVLNCDPEYPDDLHVILPWFNQSKCKLGIADGMGLNYVARNRIIAMWIEGL